MTTIIGKQLFDFMEADAEAVVQPDAGLMISDGKRKPP